MIPPWRREGTPIAKLSVPSSIRDDPKARKILFDTFWTSAGWRDWRDQETGPADLDYAKAAGYMFEAVSADHDEWVRQTMKARDRLTLSEAADGFIASLSSRWLAGRSALGSMAAVRHLVPHRFQNWSVNRCTECSWWSPRQDLSALSFERHKWGGVRHGDIAYAWFDLTIFERSERRLPSRSDWQILTAILEAARSSEPEAHARDLERAIAPMLPSSKQEREGLLGILALSGVLASPEHPGMMTTWVPATEREPPPRPSKNDWLYPMFWWRGSTGVRDDAAVELFGGPST